MHLCYFVGKKVVLGLKEGNKCVGSGLAWMRSGIKGINYANSGLAWVSCEHVGQALGLHVRCLAPFRPGLEKVLNKEN